jgi:endoglucanase
MLDMHRLNEDLIPELWYDGDYGMPQLLQAWDNLLSAVGNKWNLFALDIKNEPHGMATWGAGSNETDWNSVRHTSFTPSHRYVETRQREGIPSGNE